MDIKLLGCGDEQHFPNGPAGVPLRMMSSTYKVVYEQHVVCTCKQWYC